MNYRKSLFVCLIVCLIGTGCSKNAETTFADNDKSASFTVNETEFVGLDEIRWFKSGPQNSLQFMKRTSNDNEHVIIVIFNGDTAGSYPLEGINGTHRLSYFAPGVNATTFEGSVVGGTLQITTFDGTPPCLSGNYTFGFDTIDISGQFKNLRPE